MILEYLFLDKAHRNDVEKFGVELLTETKTAITDINYKDFDSVDYWAVQYEFGRNSENDAIILSQVNTNFVTKFSPIVLINESAEYFNKSLYPLVNKFERYLRKFLYIRVAQCDPEKYKDILRNIETKDFGDIYNILFVDSSFAAEAKNIIKKINTRAEMLEAIQNLQENTAWDILVDNSSLGIIKDNFDVLKNYRNDVMHAHNIDYDTYKKAKNLFTSANSQLEAEIQRNIDFPRALSTQSNDELFDKLKVIGQAATVVGKGIEFFLDLFAKMAVDTQEESSNSGLLEENTDE